MSHAYIKITTFQTDKIAQKFVEGFLDEGEEHDIRRGTLYVTPSTDEDRRWHLRDVGEAFNAGWMGHLEESLREAFSN